MLLNGQKEDLRRIILESFRSIDIVVVGKCINRSLALLQLD